MVIQVLSTLHACTRDTRAHARARARTHAHAFTLEMTEVLCGAGSLPSSPKLEPGVAGVGAGPMSPLRIPAKAAMAVPSRLSPMRDDEVHGGDLQSRSATPEKLMDAVGQGRCRGQEEEGEEDLFDSLRVQGQGLKVASFLLHNRSHEDVVLVPMSSLDIVVQVDEAPDLAKILSKRLLASREAAAEAAKAQAEADSAKAASQKAAEAAELAAEAAAAAAAAAEKQDVDGGLADADKTEKDGSKAAGELHVEEHVEKAASAAAAAAEAERAEVAAVKAAAATAAALAAQTHGGEGLGEEGEIRKIGGGESWRKGLGEEETTLLHRRVGMNARQVGGEITIAAGQRVRVYLAGMYQPCSLPLTFPPTFPSDFSSMWQWCPGLSPSRRPSSRICSKG